LRQGKLLFMKFHYNLSPSSIKVALLLAELALDYEPIPVDTRKNPDAKVPVLEEGTVTVFGSSAILLYLADRDNRLLPGIDNPHLRAKALSWLTFIATDVENACAQARHFRYIAPKPNDYALSLFDYEAHRHWRAIEQHLAVYTYFLDQDYSIVDIAFWSWARLLPNILGSGETIWETYPNIKRLVNLVAQRPAVQNVEQLKTKHNFKVARRYRPTDAPSADVVSAAS
jgi:GSH-dependent disulfide-bond oxidoreductase